MIIYIIQNVTMDFKAIIDLIVDDPGVLDLETLRQLRMDVTVAKN
jgi:hypothetical protein